MTGKIRFEELLPHEIERIIDEEPILYLPLGTLEWHSLHLAIGNDALKAYEICLRAAKRTGGVVAPATYWAIGGVPYPWTTRFNPNLIEDLFYAIFSQMEHVGFKVIIAITGHYGIEQLYRLKRAACNFMYGSNIIIAPMPEYEVAYEVGYRGDHAAKWETSILWALRPDLVDMKRLSKDLEKPLEGVIGDDPRRYASRKLGERVVKHIVDKLSELAPRLLKKTDSLNRSKYIRALKIQVEILDILAREPYEDRMKILGSTEYEGFVDNIWNGNYNDAIGRGERLLSKIRKRCSNL